MDNTSFSDYLKTIPLEITDNDLVMMLSQFKKYCEVLQIESEKINLTAIKTTDDIYIKHFLDCCYLVPYLNECNNLLDVGSGAGFPGIVLKIMKPELEVTLLEPIHKRCLFLLKVIQELKLTKINVVEDRAELFCCNNKEKYDVVTSRAVANLRVLLELCIPNVCVGGHFLSMKGSTFQLELDEAKQAYKLLGATYVNTTIYSLPQELGNHAILDFKKISKTKDIYPRMYSKIKKNPL